MSLVAAVVIEPGLGGVCVESPGSTTLPAFDVTAAQLTLRGFATINNVGAGPMDAAIRVEDGSVSVSGAGTWTSTITTVTAGTMGIAGHADTYGVIYSELASWEETGTGIKLEEASLPAMATCAASTSVGGRFESTQSNIAGNGIGIVGSGRASVSLYRDAVNNYNLIGDFSDQAMIEVEDSGFRSNIGVDCSRPAIQVPPGIRFGDQSSAVFHNTLWRDNCTDAPDSDAPLILAEHNSIVTLQSGTFDHNKSRWQLKADNSAIIVVSDTLMTDDVGAWSGWDGGIICAGTSTVSNINYVGTYQLQSGLEFFNCSGVGASIWTTTAPGYIDLYYRNAGGGPVEVRNYYLDGSAFVDAGSASAAATGLNGVYHAVAPSLPGSGNLYSFPSDTGVVDLGFHWWAVPNVEQP